MLFPQDTTITRRATRQEAERILISSYVMMPDDILETMSFAVRYGIAYVSNWKGCVTVIPVYRRKGTKNKVLLFRVSVTQWETSLPF